MFIREIRVQKRHNMTPLRLGFIGAGVMATWAIYPALHFAPIELHGLCDLDAARAQHAAATFGAKRWYTDYQQMWAAEDLEALIIQMHPAPRQAIVREALRSVEEKATFFKIFGSYPCFVPPSSE